MRALVFAVFALSVTACGGDSHPPAVDLAPDGNDGEAGQPGSNGTGARTGNDDEPGDPGSAGETASSEGGSSTGNAGTSSGGANNGGGSNGGSAHGGMGGGGGSPGGVLCGGAMCVTGQVCCGAPYPCQDMCVPDCRTSGICPNQLECEAGTGVCVPASNGNGGSGGTSAGGMGGGGMGGMMTGGMGGMTMGGMGGMSGGAGGKGGAGGMGGTSGGAGGQGGSGGSGGSGSGGKGSGGSPGDPAECEGDLGTINTKGPSTPTAGDPYADFNVSLNACNVTQAALECQDQVLVQHYLSETLSATKRTYRSNVIPDHEVGTFPKAGQNPHYIEPQNLTYSMPLTPSGAGEALQVVFGLASSGVVFEPQTAEYYNDSEYLYEALRFATASSYDATDNNNHPGALGLDCNFAHVQSAGKYHYHGVPHAMLPASPALTFLGWAADGYPIFGVWGPLDANDLGSPLVEMTSSYRIKSGNRPEADAPPGDYDGTFVQDWEYVADEQDPDHGDLDECNGRTGQIIVPGVNGGAPYVGYHYFITHTFPYIPRCFHATPDASFDPKVSPK